MNQIQSIRTWIQSLIIFFFSSKIWNLIDPHIRISSASGTKTKYLRPALSPWVNLSSWSQSCRGNNSLTGRGWCTWQWSAAQHRPAFSPSHLHTRTMASPTKHLLLPSFCTKEKVREIKARAEVSLKTSKFLLEEKSSLLEGIKLPSQQDADSNVCVLFRLRHLQLFLSLENFASGSAANILVSLLSSLHPPVGKHTPLSVISSSLLLGAAGSQMICHHWARHSRLRGNWCSLPIHYY